MRYQRVRLSAALHALAISCFGPIPNDRWNLPFALFDGEGGAGGGAGDGKGGAGDGGTGTAKTFTQADLDAAVAGLKTKNDELLGLNKTLKGRAAVIGDRTPEDVQADLEFAAKAREDQRTKAGEFDAMKLDLVKKHELAVGGKDKRIKSLEDRLYDVHAKREVASLITTAGGNAKMLEPHILKFVKVTEDQDSGEFTATVVDAKGNPRFGDAKGTPMTLQQLVDEFKADPEWGTAFKASGASGSGAPGGTQGTGTATVIGGDYVISAVDAKDVQKYRHAREEAGKQGKRLVIGS